MMSRLLLTFAAATLAAAQATAGTGEIGPVQLETVGVVGVPIGLHLAGNVEVKITGGFTLPPGVFCDQQYITTRRTDDPERAMLNALVNVPNASTSALPRFATVYLTITDNEWYRAYPNRAGTGITPRCSVAAIRYVFN
jgi:hypothetical protein